MKKPFRGKKLLVLCKCIRGTRPKRFAFQCNLFDKVKILAYTNNSDLPWSKYRNRQHIRDFLRDYRPDVVHACINKVMVAAISMEMGFPTLLDVHDFEKLRGSEDPEAAYVFGKQPPTISVCDSISRAITQQYEYECQTVLNLAPRAWMLSPHTIKKKPGKTVVFIGSVLDKPPHLYRRYEWIFRRLSDAGIHVHIYTMNPIQRHWEQYKNTNVHIHKPILNYRLLLEVIASHTVGFAGYNAKGVDPIDLKFRQMSAPNKAFDYMAAGIPTMAINLGESDKYVKHWGCCSNDQSSAVEVFQEAADMPIDFAKWQEKFCLERYHKLFVRLYSGLLS